MNNRKVESTHKTIYWTSREDDFKVIETLIDAFSTFGWCSGINYDYSLLQINVRFDFNMQ